MQARRKSGFSSLLILLTFSAVSGFGEASCFLLARFNESTARRAIGYMAYDSAAVLPLILLLFLIGFLCTRLLRGLTGERLIRREIEGSFLRFEVALSLILLFLLFLLLPDRPGALTPLRVLPFAGSWLILSAAFLAVTRRSSPAGLFRWIRFSVLGSVAILSIGVAIRGHIRSQPEWPVGAAEGRPDILLISIDTLRADALSCDDPAGTSSVQIDRLAASGAVFRKAFAPSSWTYPSMASLMTSLPPPAHGIEGTSVAIRRSYTTLAEVMEADGYRTAAIFGNPLLDSRNGYDQGFGYFDMIDNDLQSNFLAVRLTNLFLFGALGWRPNLLYRSLIPALSPTDDRVFYFKVKLYASAREITTEALKFLQDDRHRPFFLHLHYFDPHGPYHAHPKERLPDFSARTQETLPTSRQRYLEEVTYCDGEIGKILDFLEESGLRRTTYVFLTADHGEAFLEHQVLFHGNDLHAEEVRIPLIVAGPGIAPGMAIDTPVTLTDIGPTIVDLAGIDPPEPFRGSSLVTLLNGEDIEGKMVYSMVRYSPVRLAKHVPIEKRRDAIRRVRQASGVHRGTTSQYFLSVRTKDRSFMGMLDPSDTGSIREAKLYDIESDPLEQNDISAGHPETVDLLKNAVLQWYRQNAPGVGKRRTRGEEGASEANRERLHALGYVF